MHYRKKRDEVYYEKSMGKESCVDKESLGNKNIHIKSIGFHNQNPMRIFPLWQSNKIPGK